MARRKFTREFKLSAVQLVNQQGYSVPEAAKSLGIPTASGTGSRSWARSPAMLLPGKGAGGTQAALRKENARLLM